MSGKDGKGVEDRIGGGTGGTDRGGGGAGLAVWLAALAAVACLALAAWDRQEMGRRVEDHERRLEKAETLLAVVGPRVLPHWPRFGRQDPNPLLDGGGE